MRHKLAGKNRDRDADHVREQADSLLLPRGGTTLLLRTAAACAGDFRCFGLSSPWVLFKSAVPAFTQGSRCGSFAIAAIARRELPLS